MSADASSFRISDDVALQSSVTAPPDPYISPGLWKTLLRDTEVPRTHDLHLGKELGAGSQQRDGSKSGLCEQL